MADIVTGTTAGQVNLSALHQDHADIRHEAAMSEANIRREVAETSAAAAYQNTTQHGNIVDAVKTAGWHNSDRTGTEADRIVSQGTAYFVAEQQNAFSTATALAAMRASTDASFQQTLSAIALSTQQSTAAAALAGERNTGALALGHAMLGQQILQDGNTTRALINDLKMDQLNRELIERNAALVEHRGNGRYWEGQFGNSQFAQLSSQVNALNSQMTETRQGLVNFGTMSGAAGQQSSTSNNVR